MIDIESWVYDPIAKALRTEFSGINVTSEYVRAPSAFPHVSVIENDNYTAINELDTSETERFATVMYEVNVYSNKASGKKSEARAILKKIDEMMYARNFTRIAMNPVPNMEESTIYRLTARYRAETDGNNIYRI